jgi:hypothetical protein
MPRYAVCAIVTYVHAIEYEVVVDADTPGEARSKVWEMHHDQIDRESAVITNWDEYDDTKIRAVELVKEDEDA